jgi:hypothetical protein
MVRLVEPLALVPGHDQAATERGQGIDRLR